MGSSPERSIERFEEDTGGSFTARDAGKRVGRLLYRREGDTLFIDHVFVTPALRGTGLGQQLVASAIEHARSTALHVVPVCGYARTVLRDSRYRDVVRGA